VRATVLALAGLSAVSGCGPLPDDLTGFLGAGAGEPFPSIAHLDAAGRVDLSELPAVDGERVPAQAVAWRDGFSPAQVGVVFLDGVDPDALPHWRAPTPGAGGVLLADLTTRTWLPVMAELDASVPAAQASLLIRPLSRLLPGHRVGVVVTTQAAPRPERFEQLLSRRPPASIAAWRDPARALLAELSDLGVPESEVAFAWEFPVGDPIAATRSALGALRGFESEVRWTDLREGDAAPPLALRSARATFTVPRVLDDDGRLRLGPDGEVVAQGVIEADLWLHVPSSLDGAPVGSAPVLIFGHGIFGAPELYLDADGPTDVSQLANEGGFVVVATRFTGLSRADVGTALSAANNLTRLPALTDRLVQAQVAVRALAQLVVEGELARAPALQHPEGGSIIEEGPGVYHGISLGGIQGAVAVELGLPVRAATLHVGGAMWSTMLERSSNFEIFDGVVRNVIPDPQERALLLSWTQLHWDLIDPMSGDLGSSTIPVLLQEALHDEQVPNLTTRALARAANFPAVGPMVEEPWAIARVAAPTPGLSSAYVQYDPLREAPVDANRPAAVTGAHGAPRNWPGYRLQTLTFLDRRTLGTVVHGCGDTPCTSDNPGSSQ